MQVKPIDKVATAIKVKDHDAVSVERVIGQPVLTNVAPFNVLEQFHVLDRDAYASGFIDGPNSDCQTLTYLLEGCLCCEDSTGNVVNLESGDMLWTQAEGNLLFKHMPQLSAHGLCGIQLYLSPPDSSSIAEYFFQHIGGPRVPVVTINGISVRVLAGEFHDVIGPVVGLRPSLCVLDISNVEPSPFRLPMSATASVAIYCLQGQIEMNGKVISPGQLATLGHGNMVAFECRTMSRALLISA